MYIPCIYIYIIYVYLYSNCMLYSWYMIYMIYIYIYIIYMPDINMIWYDMIWYDVMWYDVIWYDIGGVVSNYSRWRNHASAWRCIALSFRQSSSQGLPTWRLTAYWIPILRGTSLSKQSPQFISQKRDFVVTMLHLLFHWLWLFSVLLEALVALQRTARKRSSEDIRRSRAWEI